ncbi:MetQ/NlpA family ABC transporter substrate-binding protein [Crenobacter sp. SG2303]|uniref:MetQ/NlpA family ABC transporter substrate-binding protein n=1 Tax=Crenobacter oryzisoli TaxID=3056844 RepID=A0ABT7XQW3_9NEIS|nr:MetQ/NlpA family ABC transporter substrate-binding protein [Crenobacter sp. SG2303]MDN0076135.1 MetQ/NlpA family ABC transporter substrate-binding protein [Crenobacter sp. SG2303]
MKTRQLLLSTLLGLGVSLAAQADTLTVGAEAVPHAEILEHIKPVLAKEGIDLKVKVFTNGQQENFAVAQKELDANYFQHKPFLDGFNKAKGTQLVSVAAIHVEPFGAYSRKIGKLSELRDGAVVAVPNDPSNAARALLLLQKNGLIRLRDPNNILSTARDIVVNPKKLQIRELEGATLSRVLDQVDLALINTNYALQAKLQPRHDALFIEDSQSPYANILVARPDNHNSPTLKKLVAALTSSDVRQFIDSRYQGAVVPVF